MDEWVDGNSVTPSIWHQMEPWPDPTFDKTANGYFRLMYTVIKPVDNIEGWMDDGNTDSGLTASNPPG